MSVKLTIGNTVINFPTSGTDANWAEAVTEFALAVENRLFFVALPYDIAPQVRPIIESGTVSVTNALGTFPNAEVRSFIFTYSTYRIANSPTVSKTQNGTVIGVHDENTNVWTLQHEFTGDKQANGESYLTFDMSGDSLIYTAVGFGGTYNTVDSTISFSAKTLPVTN